MREPRLGAARASEPQGEDVTFQVRVKPWLMACFGETIANDREERNHRFLEEALELVQACGCTASEAHQLVDYTFGREVGEPRQESGGVSVTHAALCLANGIDMHEAAETELARIWTKVEKIRAKQAAKPKHSPLPEATAGLGAAMPRPEPQPADPTTTAAIASDPTGWSNISRAAREVCGLEQEQLADLYNNWIGSLPWKDQNPHQFKAFLAGVAFAPRAAPPPQPDPQGEARGMLRSSHVTEAMIGAGVNRIRKIMSDYEPDDDNFPSIVRRVLEAALAADALAPETGDGWLPIETAPADTKIQVCQNGWVATMRVTRFEDESRGTEDWTILHYNGDSLVTHFHPSPNATWRPLPAPPAPVTK